MLVLCLPGSPGQNDPGLGPVRRKGVAPSAPQQVQAPWLRRCEAVEQAFPAFGRVLPLPVL